ncbi:MAG TPA: SatD family protein [Bacillota bacterium]|jgi:hypothetical protein
MRLVTVITADVIGSRGYEGVQVSLENRLRELSHPNLVLPFTVSRGDEVQGVCSGYLTAPELVRHLRYRCRPFALRVGIGLGPAPEQRAQTSWNLTGEAFFRSRDALDSLKGGRHPGTAVVSGNARADVIAGGLLELMDAVFSRWTDEQWEAVQSYELEGTYEAAGRKLGIALQNVEKRCRAARWAAVRRGEAALRDIGQLVAAHPA